MTIATVSSKPTPFSLGSAQFFSAGSPETNRLFKIEADAEPSNPQPICLQVGVSGHRTAVTLSVEDAEALGSSLAKAVCLRKAAEAKAAKTQHHQARAFFADSDGPLETAG